MNDTTTTTNQNETSTPAMTYDEKMAFLANIRLECGLGKVEVDQFTDECPRGKYLEIYTFGVI